MKFSMRAISISIDGSKLEVLMEVCHPNDAVRGNLSVVIDNNPHDTLAQIAVRAGEKLGVAMTEDDD